MTSLTQHFSTKGQRNWIMKAIGRKIAVYYDGKLLGYFNKIYVQKSWRSAYGYTLPESVIMAGNYANFNT